MNYDRLTNVSYAESVKRRLSPEYQRLALLEDAIESNKLLYAEVLIDKLKAAKTYAESKRKTEEVDALSYVIKLIQRGV